MYTGVPRTAPVCVKSASASRLVTTLPEPEEWVTAPGAEPGSFSTGVAIGRTGLARGIAPVPTGPAKVATAIAIGGLVSSDVLLSSTFARPQSIT